MLRRHDMPCEMEARKNTQCDLQSGDSALELRLSIYRVVPLPIYIAEIFGIGTTGCEDGC